MLRGGIALHCVPGAYEYKVVMGLRQLKVQLWGGGGASGHLKGQQAGGGGGGAFVEALLNVIPGETLEIVVGAGGAKGQYGGTVQIVREDDPTKFETEEVRSRRPAVLRCLHAIDATRVHQTRSWVVSFSSLRPFGPSRATAMLRAGHGAVRVLAASRGPRF